MQRVLMRAKRRLSASVDVELVNAAHAAVDEGRAARVSGGVNDTALPLTRTSCYTGFVVLRNVTITLDEETARWARVEAARRDVSVSRFIGQMLHERMDDDVRYEQAMKSLFSRRPRPLGYRANKPTRDELHDRAALRGH
jgi:hypothetical protein